MIRISSNENSSAIKAFMHFVNNISDNHVNELDDLDEKFLCSIETWQLFAGHLMRMAVNGQIMKGTAEVYLNGAKHAVRERHKDNVIFKETDWQSKLVANMTNEIKAKCVRDHIRFDRRKMTPIGGDGLRRISEYLLQQNNIRDVIFWASYSTCFEFAGRSGELPFQNYDNCWWNDVHDCFCIEWVEKKTRKTVVMPVVSSTVMESDWFFAMFCFIMINGGATSTYNPSASTEAIFPNPECDGNSLNKRLRDIKSTGLFDDMMRDDITTKAFRVGKMAQITECPTGDLTLCMIRGKWQEYMKQFYNVLEYWFETMMIAIRAARAGNGWKNCKQKVFTPSFYGLFDDDTTVRIKKLCHLLCHAHTHFSYDRPAMKHMEAICHRMFATFLMYVNDFIGKYNVKHIIIVELLKHAKQNNVSLDELKRWGDIIKKDWLSKNAVHIDSISDIQPALASLSEQLALLKIENERVKASVTDVMNQNKQLLTDNKEMLTLLQRIATNIENAAVLHPTYEKESPSPLSPPPVQLPVSQSDTNSLAMKRPATTDINDLLKKASINHPAFPTDDVTKILALWYGFKFDSRSHIQIEGNCKAPRNYVGRIKALILFIENNNIGESVRKVFMNIRSIDDANEKVRAKNSNMDQAKNLFRLVMQCLHNKDKKGSDTTNVKLDAIARRLTELQKQKEPAIQNSNTKDDNGDDTVMTSEL